MKYVLSVGFFVMTFFAIPSVLVQRGINKLVNLYLRRIVRGKWLFTESNFGLILIRGRAGEGPEFILRQMAFDAMLTVVAGLIIWAIFSIK